MAFPGSAVMSRMTWAYRFNLNKPRMLTLRLRMGLLTLVGSSGMGREVNTNELIDAQGVADLLGLAQRNTVSLYQRRYPDMPRPVVDLGRGRCKMWLESEIRGWNGRRFESEDT